MNLEDEAVEEVGPYSLRKCGDELLLFSAGNLISTLGSGDAVTQFYALARNWQRLNCKQCKQPG